MNKELNFRYRMLLQFDSEITGHHYTLKCLPESNLRQRITALDIKLLPAGLHWESRDAFGNRELLGVLPESHDHFSAEVSGEVQLLLGPMSSAEDAGSSLTLPDGTTLYAEQPVREEKLGIYRYPTALTRPGEKIRGFFEECDACASSAAMASWAVQVMRKLHNSFTYQKCATDVHTSAEEAMAKGAGVCQDYAHIFLSLLRLKGIPARYVTGMLRGEGESHAWVELALGNFWYGLDPTNDCAVAGEHVRIACGRDYGDCRISQGVFFGGARQTQQVEVKVYPTG